MEGFVGVCISKGDGVATDGEEGPSLEAVYQRTSILPAGRFVWWKTVTEVTFYYTDRP